MKRIKFILVALVAAFTLSTASVYAQEDGNRDANGYVVRGPYVTNGGGSNWFVGLGGGVNTTLAEGQKIFSPITKDAFYWGAEAFVGKWFTPTVGVRAGYKGGINTFDYDPALYFANYGSGQKVSFGYAHGDLMWNISNAISGYKETRFWDFVPYAGAGYLGINNGATDNKFAASVGLYNKFRLGKVVNLYLDVNVIGTENPVGLVHAEDGSPVVNGDTPVYRRPLYMPTATVGVTFNLGRKKNFDRLSSVLKPYEQKNAELTETVTELANENKTLREQNELLKKNLTAASNKPAEQVVVKETRVLTGSTIITFEIGSAALTPVERQKVELFAESLDNDTLVLIVGSADSKTGTETRNFALAHNRAEVVKNTLISMGVAADRITTDAELDATENVETSRSAILTISL